MALRYECDDCGELIEQLRIIVGKDDLDLNCLLKRYAEETESAIKIELVNPSLTGYFETETISPAELEVKELGS